MIPTRVILTTNREAVVAAEVVAEDEAIADEDEAETAAEDEAETAVEAVTTKKEETTSANSKIKAESNKKGSIKPPHQNPKTSKKSRESSPSLESRPKDPKIRHPANLRIF
jgi:hypothetical protein